MRLQWIRIRDEETEQILVDTMRNILMKAWGVYFSRTSDNIHEYSDPQEIEDEYEEFLENLEEYFPKDKKTVSEAVSHITSTEQLKMIDELAGEILKTIGILMQMLPEPVKKVLENRAVQGVMKVTGGVSEIATGCGACSTAVGCIQGIPLIIFGTNMAFEGIQDLWYTLRGELDHESKNLIKEATGHKVDNLVELSEIGMSIYAGKVASKKITGKLGEESEKLSGLLKKTRKPVSIATRTKRLVKKFMPKKRYRKFKVVDVEELSKKQGLISLTESELENTIGGAKDPNWKPNKGKGSKYGFNVTEEGNVRKFNIKKQESSIWKNFENVKGKDRKCSGFGKNKNYYEWDYTHNDIEVYDCRGRHLGSLNPITGELYKPAVDGRNITI